jgi:formylglycine-generating enzyme required for sulfatase activity
VREGRYDETEIGSFYLSKLPITSLQYEAFDPSYRRPTYAAGDEDAAVGVRFEQARGYCEWYARVSRKPMRLPTEIEWSYACDLGEPLRLSDAQIPHAGNSGEQLPDLKRTQPSKAGFIAMLGGVWEWTAEGQLRGGSFRCAREQIALDCRHADPNEADYADVGFRIARSL